MSLTWIRLTLMREGDNEAKHRISLHIYLNMRNFDCCIQSMKTLANVSAISGRTLTILVRNKSGMQRISNHIITDGVHKNQVVTNRVQ